MLRALVVATNSLRYNPNIDQQTADLYEMRLINLRDTLVNEQEGSYMAYNENDKHCRECICPSCDLFQEEAGK